MSLRLRVMTSIFFLVLIIASGYKIIKTYAEKSNSSRIPSSTTQEDSEQHSKSDDSFPGDFFFSEEESRLKAEKQEDMNIICRSRSAVKIASSSYDDYIWKCNNPPYGVRYTDCSQYNANVMANQVRQIANQRIENELALSRKWKIDPTRDVTCY